MPPRRTPRPTPPDVEVLRSALMQGKLVRVGIAPSGQFPDGVTGRVRRIGDPAADGDEFIFVEVPVGGVKDVLPFAVGDLISAPVRRKTAAAPVSQASLPGPAPVGPMGGRPVAPAVPVGGRPVAPAVPVGVRPVADATPTPVPVPVVTLGRSKPGAAAGPGSGPEPTEAAAKAPGDRGARSPGPTRGRRPPVTITISTAGDDSASWRIDAKIGARTAVRSTPVPPARVWEIVQSLGDAKLSGVVKTLLDDHRRSTQARADALAAELSSLHAELSLFPPGVDR